ncbi:MAG: DNA-binding protein YbiB [Acidithiobacillus sp.]|nr:DNA-binding protein YbiB [Acidithiobacillus sp.]
MSTWKQYLSRVARGREHAEDLRREEAEELMGAWLHGELPELYAGAFWVAYRIKSESLDELLGFHDAVRARMSTISRPGRLRPVVFASYNGTRRCANLLPLLALTLTRCGVPVLIHGADLDDLPGSASADHSPQGRVHTGQILEHLGLAAAANLAQAETLLQLQGLVYLPLSAWQPGLARIFALRENLGIRSSVHTLLKGLHPFAPQEAIVCAAVTHPPYLQRLQEFFLATEIPALCFRATEGEPFANPQRRPDLFLCHQGESRLLLAKDHASLAQLPELPDNLAASTSEFISAVLDGRRALPLAIAEQTAALLLLSGRCADLATARALLRQSFTRIAA